MVPDFHAEKGSKAAAQEGNGEEAGFGDAPFVVPRLPFVNAIEKESNDIDCREIDQNAI